MSKPEEFNSTTGERIPLRNVQPAGIRVTNELLANLLRRDYLEDARWVISEACVLAGHPAKIDKPFEMKSEWQRGCVCGRNPFA